jgi:hypothetical protein
MYCRTCSQKLPDRTFACTNCGCRPLFGNRYCMHCGALSLPNAVVCVKCRYGFFGAGVSPAEARRFDKGALCILSLFVGGLGFHKFYTRNWGWGILYILFCWTLVPAIVSFIEFIGYALTPEEALRMRCAAASSNPFGWV